MSENHIKAIAECIRDGFADGLDEGTSMHIARNIAALATQPATSQEGEALALRAIKAVTATAKDGAAGLSRIMAIANAAGVQASYSELLQDPAVALIVDRPRTEWAHLFKPDATSCAIPPEGWQCSRARGHTGPCAATPTPPTLSEDLREALKPFADAAADYDYHDGQPAFDEYPDASSLPEINDLTIGNLRAARAALVESRMHRNERQIRAMPLGLAVRAHLTD